MANKVSEITDSDDGVEGIVICETAYKMHAHLCKAKTMNEFKQIGQRIMPEATKISMCRHSGWKHVLLDGPGFDWNILLKA